MEIQNKIEYTPAVTLDKALRYLQKQDSKVSGFNKEELDIFVKNVAKNEDLSSMKVSKYFARGALAIVFETPDGEVLKLTQGNHFPMNRPIESFDVPVFKKGRAGDIYYYLEEKLFQNGLSQPFVEMIKDKIKERGYRTFDLYDFDFHQIGFSKEGRLYLLDPECAKYKTIFHAAFDKLKKLLKK